MPKPQHPPMTRRRRELLEQRDAVWRQVQTFEGRDLLASEQRKYDGLLGDLERLGREVEEETTRSLDEAAQWLPEPGQRSTNPVPGDHGPGNESRSADERISELADGQPLRRGDTFGSWVRERAGVEDFLGRRSSELGRYREGDAELDAGRYLRGIVTGQWSGADSERRAMAEGTMPAGGYLVPTALSAQIIDRARPQTRVLEAGAQVVPMANRVVDVPTWTADPAPSWRAESEEIVERDGAVGRVRLQARSLAVISKVTFELLEDAPNLESALLNAAAAQFAISVDSAALYGDGTPVPVEGTPQPLGDAPVGVRNTDGVTITPLATNGAQLTYDHLLDVVGSRADANERVSGLLMSPRSRRRLASAKDTTGQYLAPPASLADVALLDTNQVPNDRTQGTKSSASDVFAGDWSQLYVGVRTSLQIIPLRERFATSGHIGFLFWWRGDVRVARPGAFEVLTGAL